MKAKICLDDNPINYRHIFLPFFFLFSFCAQNACSQLLGYESFSEMPLGGGISGSGSDSTGWAIDWNGSTDARFNIIDPSPQLSYQPSGAALIKGGNRAIMITTSPEPVPGNHTIFRSFRHHFVHYRIQFSTLWNSGLRPNHDYSTVTYFGAARGWNCCGGSSAFYTVGETYLALGIIEKIDARRFRFVWRVDGLGGESSSSATADIDEMISTIGLGISSSDTGGPTTTVIIDEIRVGYTRADVIPPFTPSITPTVEIVPAHKIQWLTVSGTTYQVQVSFDLQDWINFGSPIAGDGTVKFLFDEIGSKPQKFYRVEVQ